jgi:hypothetical protein
MDSRPGRPLRHWLRLRVLLLMLLPGFRNFIIERVEAHAQALCLLLANCVVFQSGQRGQSLHIRIARRWFEVRAALAIAGFE